MTETTIAAAGPAAPPARPQQAKPLPRRARTRSRRRSNAVAAAFALIGGLVWTLRTQFLVALGASGSDALLGFGVAAALFVLGLIQASNTGLLAWPGPVAKPDEPLVPPAQPVAPPPELPMGSAAAAARPAGATARALPRRPARGLGIARRLALASLALGAITFLASGGNQFTAFNVTTWVASVALGLAACWQPPARLPQWRALAAAIGRFRIPRIVDVRLPWTALALALVVAFGAFLLFYRIADVPREMTSDHAEKLLDVQDVLDGQHRIFFPRNTGREAFQFYWIALMTPLTGLSYLTLKLGTALLACFTIPFTFLFARVFFGARFALLATTILATSRWHLQVARVGLRFPFPPLFGAATFYFLLKAIRDRRRNDFLLCGLALGVAQHTYTALRLAPLAVLGCLGIALAVDVWRREPPARVRRLVVEGVLLFAIAGLVFMPLLRYAVDEPRMFLFRGVSRLASDAGTAPPPDLLGVFLGNVKNAFLMFNWRGDLVWVNTIPGLPVLEPVSGALFVLGCAYALYRLVRYRELPYLYLFVLLFVGLLPSILSLAFPAENPSAARSGMAIPVVMVFVALPAWLLVQRLPAWLGRAAGRATAAAALGALLLAIFANNFSQYFTVYAAQHTRASQHASLVGGAVNGFVALGGRRDDVSILPGPHWVDWRLVAIEAGDVKWTPLIPNVAEARKRDGIPRERLYIVHPDDRASLDALSRWYPTALRHTHTLDDGRPWFVTVLVPAGAAAAE